MIADVLLVIAVLFIVIGAFRRRERWGVALLSAGVAVIVAVLLLSGTDVSESFISGVKDGFRGAGGE